MLGQKRIDSFCHSSKFSQTHPLLSQTFNYGSPMPKKTIHLPQASYERICNYISQGFFNPQIHITIDSENFKPQLVNILKGKVMRSADSVCANQKQRTKGTLNSASI